MDEPTASAQSAAAADGGPDLAALEQIERELFAVERALEQIDQGIYDGFEGIEGPAGDASTQG